jgi:TPR repeat protein
LADAGDPHAAYWYGHALDRGLGTPVDVKAAMTQYAKASAGGVTQAGTRLGELYLDGNAVPPDFAKARSYLTEAAPHGSGANKLRAAPGNAGVRRRLFYYAASTEFQMAGAPLPSRRNLRRLNCPFRIRRSSSIPAIVTAAVLNRLNPSSGPMRAFTPR